MRTFILKLLDTCRWAFTSNGIDYDQLRAVISVKLVMDNRRHIISYERKSQKEPKNTFVVTMLFYIIFGGFVGLVIATTSSLLLGMIIFFSYVMVMVIMTLITDFSSVLLDTSDNTIILPRPVDSRTLFAARTIHILIYLAQLSMGLSVIPFIVVAVKYGILFSLFFLVAVFLAVVASLFITNLLYLLIMQFTSEEKLKNIINYFQIFMAVGVMAGYQLAPRLMDRMGLKVESFELSPWSSIAPPVWMAGALEAIHFNQWDSFHLALTVCAITIPLGGTWLINRHLTPLFSRKLSVMDVSPKQKRERTATITAPQKNSLLNTLSAWLTVSFPERGAFELVYKALARDRKLKLKIYPSFGYALIFGVILFVNMEGGLSDFWATLPSSRYYLVLIYILFMVILVAHHEIPYSDEYRASWIYFSSPLDKPGDILSGMIKAIFVRLFLPGYILITAIVLSVWGLTATADVLFGMLNSVIMLLMLALISPKALPLSIAPNLRAQSGTFVRALLIWLVVGVLAGLHVILTTWKHSFLWYFIPLQVGLSYAVFRIYRSTKWSEIRV